MASERSIDALRDELAGRAMQGIVSSIDSEENYQRLRGHGAAEGLRVSEWIAREAYKQADAMIDARRATIDQESEGDGPEELRTEVYVSVSVLLGRGLKGHEAMIAEEAMKATLRARTQQEPEGDGMQLTEEDIRDAFQGEDVTPGWAQCNRVAHRLSATLRAQPRRMASMADRISWDGAKALDEANRKAQREAERDTLLLAIGELAVRSNNLSLDVCLHCAAEGSETDPHDWDCPQPLIDYFHAEGFELESATEQTRRALDQLGRVRELRVFLEELRESSRSLKQDERQRPSGGGE